MILSGHVDSPPIVVLGGSEEERAAIVAQLAASGLPARGEVRVTAQEALPGLLVVIGESVAEMIAQARDVPAFAEVPILALVPAIPATAVSQALAAGATDVAPEPVLPAVLVARCRNLARLGRRDVAGAQALARINDVLTADGDDAEALVQVLQITATVLGFDRASLVAHIEGSDHAFVIAASDADPMQRFTLVVSEYPEVVEAMRTGNPVLIGLQVLPKSVLRHTPPPVRGRSMFVQCGMSCWLLHAA